MSVYVTPPKGMSSYPPKSFSWRPKSGFLTRSDPNGPRGSKKSNGTPQIQSKVYLCFPKVWWVGDLGHFFGKLQSILTLQCINHSWGSLQTQNGPQNDQTLWKHCLILKNGPSNPPKPPQNLWSWFTKTPFRRGHVDRHILYRNFNQRIIENMKILATTLKSLKLRSSNKGKPFDQMAEQVNP